LPPPETPLEYLATIAGMTSGMLQDPIAWAALMICFAAGISTRTVFVPLIFATVFQLIVVVLVRPKYFVEYGSYHADEYLMQDQVPFLFLRLCLFWIVWLAGWLSRKTIAD
jgi:hypothetical protein